MVLSLIRIHILTSILVGPEWTQAVSRLTPEIAVASRRICIEGMLLTLVLASNGERSVRSGGGSSEKQREHKAEAPHGLA